MMYASVVAGVLWLAGMVIAARGDKHVPLAIKVWQAALVVTAAAIWLRLVGPYPWQSYGALAAVLTVLLVKKLGLPKRRLKRAAMPKFAEPWESLDVAKGWRMNLAPGRHTLIAGATGAGKGGALWAIIKGLHQSVLDGYVRLVVIDPKGGMELSPTEAFADVFVYDDGEGFYEHVAEVLERECELLTAKANELKARQMRKCVVSSAEPFTVVVIDEMLSITDEVNDPALKRRIGNALHRILRQGRAPGWTVVACVQDPTKEALGSRTSRGFVQRICLRVNDYNQADVVLGPGVRTTHGADAHLIPKDRPGEAYVWDDELGEALKIRFKWVSDKQIEALTGPQDATPDTPFLTLDAVIDVWPMTSRGPSAAAHIGELADALVVTADELTDWLERQGVTVHQTVAIKRDGEHRRAPGVRLDEVANREAP